MGQPLAIVTSQWSIVPTGIYGLMMLRSTRVKGIASTRRERWLGRGGWIHKLHIFVYFHFHFQTPVFQHGASLVIIITIIVIVIIIIIFIIIIISPVSEGSGDVMVLRRSRPPPATRRPPPAMVLTR